MMRWIKWGLFVALVASLTHYTAVAALPEVIMWRVQGVIGTKGTNRIAHGERPTAAARAIVKPSPDLLYSVCLYDVSQAPLKITTGAPQGTYWSVALYASNTDNFYVLNDTMAEAKPATVILMGQGQTLAPQPEGTRIVTAPTPTGLVLLRTLINDDAREGDIDKERRIADCDRVRP